MGDLLDKVLPDTSNKIAFINQGKNAGRNIPMVEVKLESRELAFKLRNTFATKKKNGEDYGRIHIANSVCLATRVRADILRAIAKQMAPESGEDMFVSAYNSRPVLHIKGDTNTQRPFVMTFADAVRRFGGKIKDEYLEDAYKRAGNSFKGQLEQHFVVLHDSESTNESRQMNDGQTQQRKRPFEMEQQEISGKGKEMLGATRGRGKGKSVLRGGRGGVYGSAGQGSSKNPRIEELKK